MSPRADQHGMTLVEVLLSLFCSSLLLVGLLHVCRTMIHGLQKVEVAAAATQSAQVAIAMIEQDLRGARFSPAGPLVDGVRLATSESIEVASDLNGDGDTTDPNEMVGYIFNPSKRTLFRSMGGAPAQPMLEGIAANGVEFTYFDRAGAPLPASPAGLSAAQRARIGRADVSVSLEIRNPDPAARAPIRAHASASVCLRNG